MSVVLFCATAARPKLAQCVPMRKVTPVRTANKTTNLKPRDCDQEGQLQREVLVDFSPGRLEGGDGEEEGGAVPADLIEALELVCDPWDGCGHNGLWFVRNTTLFAVNTFLAEARRRYHQRTISRAT